MQTREVSTLSVGSQLHLLTAIQKRRIRISARSPGSGSSVMRTDPVPCDVVLVLTGNEKDVAKVPRDFGPVWGCGYEVLMATEMLDIPEKRALLAQFVAWDVAKDGHLPHTPAAVEAIVEEARRWAPLGHLTLRLRELGGLVRAAGDVPPVKGLLWLNPGTHTWPGVWPRRWKRGGGPR